MIISRTLMITETVTLTDSEEFPSAFMKKPSRWILFPSSVLFRILSSLPPSLPPAVALTSALPTCLCPLGCASSPAVVSQLMNQAAGQPEISVEGRPVFSAPESPGVLSVWSERMRRAGGGTSAQFNVFYSTRFIRGWWSKGKDSGILMCVFKSITETVD